MTTADTHSRLHPAVGTALLLAAAALVAVALNAAIAWVGVTLGAPAGYGPLSLPAQAIFTVIGVAVGWIGWRLVTTRARHPRRVLRILVPVVTALTLVPDLLLLAAPVIPGTNAAAVVSLMCMHLVVVACAIPAYILTMRLQPTPTR
ncbi:DUF6069 family protein [Herbiconiux sp. A18JL235]|uniref:DUF6069 family protein n=1 Tax=Herbiconiux sp. A18JL235 TaxID=3152363 RepID=A0AB39BED7_9MICO